MVQQVAQPIQLPFKPFVAAEVVAITKCPADLYDKWAPKLGVVPPDPGVDGEPGLTYIKMFALFVGWKWRQENCPPGRDLKIALFIATYSEQGLFNEIAAGNTFPVLGDQLGKNPLTGKPYPSNGGLLVPTPDKPSAKRLDLRLLLNEFKTNVAKVFPNR